MHIFFFLEVGSNYIFSSMLYTYMNVWMVGFMSSSSSSCSSSLTFQSSEFSSSSISNRLARWCEMITELELSLYNRTGRRNDKSAR